ncbi:hypothetical protein IFM89_024266 [Coptis chinensis]|uniref:Uncharacterized protein n=1 Tax=Coptis chinensis TaxID=261450 RepID=A0A835HPF0_9MAGN|nr:hypothetical protein IFM89_024266 [Coptis chinensis]
MFSARFGGDTATWQLIVTRRSLALNHLSPPIKGGSGKFALTAWSLDGRNLACGSMDGTISVFDERKLNSYTTLRATLCLLGLAYSPIHPRVLYSASMMHTYICMMQKGRAWLELCRDQVTGPVQLWDLSMRAVLSGTMSSHKDQVWGWHFVHREDRVGFERVDDKSISLYDYS